MAIKTQPAFTPNPLTTVSEPNLVTIDRTNKLADAVTASLVVAASTSATYTLPDNTIFPQVYLIHGSRTTASKNNFGILTILGPSQVTVTNLGPIAVAATSSTADGLAVSLSAGVLTIAQSSGTNTEAVVPFLHRLF